MQLKTNKSTESHKKKQQWSVFVCVSVQFITNYSPILAVEIGENRTKFKINLLKNRKRLCNVMDNSTPRVIGHHTTRMVLLC